MLYSRKELINILKECFDTDPKREPITHQRIKRISEINTIITTNYDRLFEIAYNDNINVIIGSEYRRLGKWMVDLYKIHGDTSVPGSIIITSEDYKRIRESNDIIMWNIISGLSAKKSILFVGYSLKDKNVQEMLERIIRSLYTAVDEFFIVTPELPGDELNDLKKICKITHIELKGEELFERIKEKIKPEHNPDGDAISKEPWQPLEKNFSPEESLKFLRVNENVRFVSNGIKEQLTRREYFGDNETLLKAFCEVMSNKGVGSENGKCEEEWLIYNVLPDKISSIKMCFAFDLSNISEPKTAVEFLRNVCRINGFNYRVAKDIIYKYALDHHKSYEYAEKLIARYEAENTVVIPEGDNETKGTSTLISIFSNLDNVDDDELIKMLGENRKNFIGYNRASLNEFIMVYNSLIDLVSDGKNEQNITTNSAKIIDYSTRNNEPIRIDLKPIFDGFLLALIARQEGDKKLRGMLSFILDNYPIGKSNFDMRGAAKSSADAKDLSHGFARMIFIICFFSKYILKWVKPSGSLDNKSPCGFYNDFYIYLNTVLNRCSYGALYPAHPFDRLILKFVKMLDDVEPYEDMNVVELFTETLKLLANEYECFTETC